MGFDLHAPRLETDESMRESACEHVTDGTTKTATPSSQLPDRVVMPLLAPRDEVATLRTSVLR